MNHKNKTPAPCMVAGVGESSRAARDANNNTPANEPRLRKSKPRDRRCLLALATSPTGVMRSDLDKAVGTTNSSQYILHRRLEGWSVDTTRVAVVDRDGRVTHPGRYQMSAAHRAIAMRILGVSDAAE